MAGSVNKVILVGNLGQDPEVRTFQNGGKVCNLRVATSETWRDRTSGERKERTDWHTVAIFAEPLQAVAEQYLRKGSKVYLEGQLETRKWQAQDGSDRYSTEIVLRPFRGTLTLLDPAQGDQDGRGGQGARSGQRGGQQSGASGGRQAQGGQQGSSRNEQGRGRQGHSYGANHPLDDDIPFAPCR